MAQPTHDPIKDADKIVKTAVAALEDGLVIPGLFDRKGIDEYKGAKDDTINHTVEGILPYRTYGWRNDRSTTIQYDTYKERKVQLTFGDDIYQGVELTDEQATMDFEGGGWAKLSTKQAEAIGRGLEYEAADALVEAPFEVVVTLQENAMRKSLVRLQSIFDKLMVPGRRQIVVDSDTQIALLDSADLQLREFVGDGEAVPALREASLGRRFTFDFVKANELPNGTSVAFVDGGFVFLTGAPPKPRGVAYGATASANGVALQWTMDYDNDRRKDRSVMFAYKGFQYVDDPLIGRDQATKQAFVSEANHFVRAVKLQIGSTYAVDLVGTTAHTAELAKVTGIQEVAGIDLAPAPEAPVTP